MPLLVTLTVNEDLHLPYYGYILAAGVDARHVPLLTSTYSNSALNNFDQSCPGALTS